MNREINVVNKALKFPQVTLKEPLSSGFILIAAEVDKKSSIWGESNAKKSLIKKVKTLGLELQNNENVVECSLFKASLFPPGRDGELIRKLKKSQTIHTQYDVVLLIELSSVEKINEIKNNRCFTNIISAFKDLSSYHFIFNAKNLRRIDNVNHKKNGVFLFNFFVAKNKEQNLGIWEYTAGWFQDQANLNNSTLFDSIDTVLWS